ncbi:MAG: oxidoreductase [Cyclobacteriaceae bacterium]|nr:MAG: oxidoreductase [Cyclobacteriaceae bacterium]
MNYTTIEHTDLKVSKICLGTMTWGQQNNESDGHQQMSYATDHGVNFFDTAEMYSIPPKQETYGSTERIIGSWFKQTGMRDKVILATKIAGKAGFTKHIRDETYTRQAFRDAVEGSLSRLATDYIDLYQLHWPERKTNYFGSRGYNHSENEQWIDNIHEILVTLGDLIKEGKIRYIGVSNETPWGVMRYLNEFREHGLPRMVSIQNPYSLLNRSFETGLAEIAIREQIKLLAYSPLAFGVLSGKYLNGLQPEKARLTLFPHYTRYANPQVVEATERYVKLARHHNLSPAQMALAFVNSRPFVQSNIIGATTVDQLKENIESINLVLDPALIEAIDHIHELYPDPAP